jgi:hypothetical protein
VRIYLSTEGTYPFVLGGVSTWVDMLVHGLPHHEFDIGAVVDNPGGLKGSTHHLG